MRIFSLVFTLFWILSPSPLRADEKSVDQEAFGKLTLGQGGEDIMRLLGKPGSKGKDANWEAIGQWVQEWNYPAQGLTLFMASGKRGGARTLLNISASAGCTLSTARGEKRGQSYILRGEKRGQSYILNISFENVSFIGLTPFPSRPMKPGAQKELILDSRSFV